MEERIATTVLLLLRCLFKQRNHQTIVWRKFFFSFSFFYIFWKRNREGRRGLSLHVTVHLPREVEGRKACRLLTQLYLTRAVSPSAFTSIEYVKKSFKESINFNRAASGSYIMLFKKLPACWCPSGSRMCGLCRLAEVLVGVWFQAIRIRDSWYR